MSDRDGESAGSDKDERMRALQTEISRLEKRNEIISNDRTEYDIKLQRALLRGVSRVPTEPMKLLKHPVAPERDDLDLTSSSSSDTDVDESLSPGSATQQNPPTKKQPRGSKNSKVNGSRKK